MEQGRSEAEEEGAAATTLRSRHARYDETRTGNLDFGIRVRDGSPEGRDPPQYVSSWNVGARFTTARSGVSRGRSNTTKAPCEEGFITPSLKTASP